MAEPTLRQLNILTYLTTRVWHALEGVDLIQIECLPEEHDGKPVMRCMYVGSATPQEVIDCVTSAGDFGYAVQSQQFQEKIGVQ